jgi:O-antigen/teichoic acid export membrane protein
MKNWVASVLALVAAAGTIATIVLWIEIGVVGAAITFATTITLIYVVVLLIARMTPRHRQTRSAEAEVAAPAFIAGLRPPPPQLQPPQVSASPRAPDR